MFGLTFDINTICIEGGMYLPKIVRVVPQDDHTLAIELDNRHNIIYDINPD